MKTSIILGPKHGDIIHGLCCARSIVKARGSICADIWLDPTPSHQLDGLKEKWEMELPMMVPLLEAQPYVLKCRIGLPPAGSPDVADLRHWRSSIQPGKHNIAAFYACIGLQYEPDVVECPWIFVNSPKPMVSSNGGSVLCSRSDRYRWGNPDYAKEIGGRKVIFAGTPAEHQAFLESFPSVNVQKSIMASDFLELAGHIQSCEEFVGGQGLAHSIAQALGKRRAYERNRGNWDTCWIGGSFEREIVQK